MGVPLGAGQLMNLGMDTGRQSVQQVNYRAQAKHLQQSEKRVCASKAKRGQPLMGKGMDMTREQ